MPFHPSEKESAQGGQGHGILSVLMDIQQHLREAHALCDALHGSVPQSKEADVAETSDDCAICFVEQQVTWIEFSSSELLSRLRDIGNRLGQIK